MRTLVLWGATGASITNELSVYKSIDGTPINTQQLLDSGFVRSVVPVFYVQESKSEAVLLDEVIVSLKPGVSAADFFDNNPTFTSYQRLAGTPDQFIGKVASGSGEAALAVVNQLQGNDQLNWQRRTSIRTGRSFRFQRSTVWQSVALEQYGARRRSD